MRTGTLRYGDERIPYTVSVVEGRSARIAVHVHPDGSVAVDAPPERSDEEIARAVHKRARWIMDHVAEARERFRHVSPREHVSGEQVLYLGRRYVLKVIADPEDPGTVRLRGARLEVRVMEPNPAKVRALMGLWYRDRATAYFRRRLGVLSDRAAWVDQPPPFRLAEMTRQWGNCSPGGDLALNIHLIKAPRDAVDYVLAHELVHLRHHHHGPAFLALMDQFHPGWRAAKRRLDGMVEVLTG